MPYYVRLIQDYAGLQQLEQAWTELLLRTQVSTVFSSFQWNSVWWRHFGAGHRLWVLVVSDSSRRIVAIAPLMLRRLGPVRKLELIGTGLSDYGDFVVDPEAIGPALSAILAYLSAHHRRWDLADWVELSANSLLLNYLRTNKARGLHIALIPQTLCSVINLPPTWEEYVGSLPRKRRYYLRSYPGKFLREQSGDLLVTTSGPDLDEAVVDFHRLHLARWDQKDDELSAEHTVSDFGPFLQEVCRELADRGWLQVLSLRVGDRTVASSINFLLRERWNGYMKGFDPAWSNARPGTVLDALRVKQAIASGASRFDFGRGDEPYKSGFGGVYSRSTRALIAGRSPRSMAALAVILLRRRYRDFRSRSQQGEPDE